MAIEYIEPVLGFIASMLSLSPGTFSNPVAFLGAILVPGLLFFFALYPALKEMNILSSHNGFLITISAVITILTIPLLARWSLISSLIMTGFISMEHIDHKWLMFVLPAAVLVFYLGVLPIILNLFY